MKRLAESTDVLRTNKREYPLIERATRSLRTALAGASLLLPVGEAKSEEPDISHMRSTILSSIPLLDSESYFEREKANEKILLHAKTWIENQKSEFPMKNEIMMKEEYSLEQNARLQRILEDIEREERSLLMLATPLYVQSGWEKDDVPTVGGALRAFNAVSRNHIALNGELRLIGKQMKEIDADALQGDSYMEILHSLLDAGNLCIAEKELDVMKLDELTSNVLFRKFSTTGAIGGELQILKRGEGKEISIELHTEGKLLTQFWECEKATAVGPDGKETTLLHSDRSGDKLTILFEQSPALENCTAIKLVCSSLNAPYEHIKLTMEKPECAIEEPMFSLHANLRQVQNKYEIRALFQCPYWKNFDGKNRNIACRVYDKEGTEIAKSHRDEDVISWSFGEKPEHAEIIIPWASKLFRHKQTIVFDDLAEFREKLTTPLEKEAPEE